MDATIMVVRHSSTLSLLTVAWALLTSTTKLSSALELSRLRTENARLKDEVDVRCFTRRHRHSKKRLSNARQQPSMLMAIAVSRQPPVKASLVNGDPVGINDLGLAMGAQGILSRSPSKTPPTRAKIPRKTSRRRQRQGFSRIKKARRVPG
jgi:hypothetical protein